MKDVAGLLAIAVLLFTTSCSEQSAKTEAPPADAPSSVDKFVPPAEEPSPKLPDLQIEILDGRFNTTASPLGTFDFKNYSYPLPRGWQNPDGSDVTLINGHLEPKFAAIEDEMSDEEKANVRSERRIGMTYLKTRYMDATGDGQDEAFVILKVETTGSAIPQLAYVYEWKEGQPRLLWDFRTGDRADGGLKDLRMENGELVVELYGQDRFLLGETETGKITGDEEQLCCPTYFTRSRYRWNGRNFQLQKARLTYSIADPAATPIENLAEIVNDPKKAKRLARK